MKKTIIISAAVCIAIGIAAAMFFFNTGAVKIGTPGGYEMFYLKNPDVKLESLPNEINNLATSIPADFIGIIGFAEYPLIIRDAWTDSSGFMTDSGGTAFLAEANLDGEKVLYYGKNGEVEKIYEPNIISAILISDGEEIAWISGDEHGTHNTVKKLKDGKITTLTSNASYYIEGGYPSVVLRGTSEGDTLIWNGDFNGFTGDYTTYLYKDGKTAPLGKNIEIRRLADNGERIFYEQDGGLYVQNGYDTENRVLIADYNCITDDSQAQISSMVLENPGSEELNYVALSQPDMSNIYVYGTNRDASQAIVNVSLYGDQKNFYYEEGKAPLFLTDRALEVVTPVGGSGADNLSEYFFTTQNDDRSYNVYRLNGELKLFFDFPVLDFKTFTETDNILYKTEENLWLYDSSTGKSKSVFEYDKSSSVFYTAASDLSVIYVSEREEGDYNRSLYAVTPDGTKTKIADDIEDYYLDGEKLFYTATGYVLHVYENGKSEELIAFGKYHDTIINWAPIRGRESGYLIIEVYADPKDGDVSNTHGIYISIDGRNFVNVMDYLS